MQFDNKIVKAEPSSEKSDMLNSVFLSNMSYEVRTQLNGILGLAQVILKTKDVDHDVQNDIKLIVESGDSLLSLFDNIMDILKINAGEMKINSKPFFLNTLMDQLFSMFMVNPVYKQKNAGCQNIVLKYNKSRENIAIMSDPDRLKQIFVNLIDNALKFTQKGFVRFGYTIKEHDITFFVVDSGIGIAQDQTEKIFGRFTQIDHTSSNYNSDGTGLGLSISKGLTTLMNGKMWCESDLGIGSSFYFTIPFRPAKMLSADSPMRMNLMGKDWSKYTVLIVEDSSVHYSVIKIMLHNTKINIIHVDSELQAVEQALLNQIDLILMDMRLSAIDAFEIIHRIKELNPALPIIAQTASEATPDFKNKCIEAGCVDFISKPICISDLLTKVSKFLPKE